MRPAFLYIFLALLAGAFLIAVVLYWSNPTQIQAIGAAGAFFATLLLLAFTYSYVRTNQDSLALLREQWNEQTKVSLRFGIRKSPKLEAQVWIVNIGRSDVLVSKITIQRPNEKTTVLHKSLVVRPGQKRFITLDPKIWQGGLPGSDVGVSLTYESLHETAGPTSRCRAIPTLFTFSDVFIAETWTR